MSGVVPLVRHPGLGFSRKGSTWRCSHKDPTWPIVLYARDIYHGTGRLLTTLTLDRHDPGRDPIRILTSSVDLLTASHRSRFAEEAAGRLRRADGTTDRVEKTAPDVVAITSMLDAMLERLSEARHEIEVVSLADVEIPKDLSPRYTVWPLVPASRPGMLVAPSGSGKSSLACLVGLTVVTGLEFLPDFTVNEQGPVIYIGQEEDAHQMRIRTEMILRGHQVQADLRHFHFMKLRGDSLVDSAELIAEKAAEYRARLIIVDSAQATWGSAANEGVREYASRWFNAIRTLETPTLIIEHPNAPDTRKGGNGAMYAAGAGVKQDRVGHAWAVRSTEIPVKEGYPFRYHVTLNDVKRNYVARQPDIHYEVQLYRHEWARFQPAEMLTAEAIVDATRQWGVLAAVMRNPDEEHEEGWTTAELQARLKMKDDRRIRSELGLDVWRPTPDGWEEKAEKVDGTGGSKTNPTRFKLVRRLPSADPVQLSMAPGDGRQVS